MKWSACIKERNGNPAFGRMARWVPKAEAERRVKTLSLAISWHLDLMRGGLTHAEFREKHGFDPTTGLEAKTRAALAILNGEAKP